MTWEYQSNFSELYPEAAIPEARRRKAVTILRVIEDYFGAGIELSSLRVLDVGASTGVMDRVLAEHFGYVLGLDIDRAAIERAMVANDLANLEFRVGNGLALDIPAESFDVVICAHVYEHVPDPDRLLSEIWRVLKPGGLCYFAAGNRLQIMEPHYRLPLLSVLPKPLAHLYLRLLGRGGHYYETHQAFWSLRRLVNRFGRVDYTLRMIDEPSRFGLDYLLKNGSFKHAMARFVARALYFLVPTYIWLLRKPG